MPDYAERVMSLMALIRSSESYCETLSAQIKRHVGASDDDGMEEFLRRLDGRFSSDVLMKISAEAYCKHFSEEEIEVLMMLCSNEEKRNILRKLPEVLIEIYEHSRKYGEKISREVVSEMLEEGIL